MTSPLPPTISRQSRFHDGQRTTRSIASGSSRPQGIRVRQTDLLSCSAERRSENISHLSGSRATRDQRSESAGPTTASASSKFSLYFISKSIFFPDLELFLIVHLPPLATDQPSSNHRRNRSSLFRAKRHQHGVRPRQIEFPASEGHQSVGRFTAPGGGRRKRRQHCRLHAESGQFAVRREAVAPPEKGEEGEVAQEIPTSRSALESVVDEKCLLLFFLNLFKYTFYQIVK